MSAIRLPGEPVHELCSVCDVPLLVVYQEPVLDKSQEGGVRLVYFCEPHWYAWHRRYQEPE